MERIQDIIIRKNLKHVATILNKNGETEKLTEGPVNINEVILGVAELNKNGIFVTEIHTGISLEGVTKITNPVSTMGLYINNEIIKEPEGEFNVPEVNFIPFKSDSWILGEFIVKTKTGKSIPRRFLKSQNLLDKFTENDEILKKLLVLNPENRHYTWDIFPVEEQNGCSIQ